MMAALLVMSSSICMRVLQRRDPFGLAEAGAELPFFAQSPVGIV